MNWAKHNPVALYAILITAFGTFNTLALSEHLLSGKTMSWLDLIFAVITAAGGVATHQSVTPIADPKLDSHTPLVPAQVQTVVTNTVPDPTVVATEYGPGHVSSAPTA